MNKQKCNQYYDLEAIRFKEFYNVNIEKFPAYIDLPTHISFFQGISLKDILAVENKRFVITSDINNLYVWGCNKSEKFNKTKENKNIIFKPYLIFSGYNTTNELYNDANNLNNEICILECKIF